MFKRNGQLHEIPTVLALSFAVIVLLSQYVQDNALAESSFTIQEIKDPRGDWINTNTKQFDSTQGERSTDILAVDYYTNSDFLNATLWLYFPFKIRPNHTEVTYGALIDADFNRRTGLDGIDYQYEIRWDNKSRIWIRTLEAWSPFGAQRTVDLENNHSGFFEHEKPYVTLSLDLDRIGNPSKYKVIFYAEIEREGVSFADFTRWVAIPSLQMDITTSPVSIELRKGEEKTIEVMVNSSQGYEPSVEITANSTVKNMNFEFPQNDTLRIPTDGLATSPLTITAPHDAPSGPYTVFISANSTFPPEELIEVESDNEENSTIYSTVPPEYVVTRSGVLVTILEPLTWIDQVDELWDKLGSPLTFFYGILAGLSPWIYTRLRKQINKGRRQKLTESDNSLH